MRKLTMIIEGRTAAASPADGVSLAVAVEVAVEGWEVARVPRDRELVGVLRAEWAATAGGNGKAGREGLSGGLVVVAELASEVEGFGEDATEERVVVLVLVVTTEDVDLGVGMLTLLPGAIVSAVVAAADGYQNELLLSPEVSEIPGAAGFVILIGRLGTGGGAGLDFPFFRNGYVSVPDISGRWSSSSMSSMNGLVERFGARPDDELTASEFVYTGSVDVDVIGKLMRISSSLSFPATEISVSVGVGVGVGLMAMDGGRGGGAGDDDREPEPPVVMATTGGVDSREVGGGGAVSEGGETLEWGRVFARVGIGGGLAGREGGRGLEALDSVLVVVGGGGRGGTTGEEERRGGREEEGSEERREEDGSEFLLLLDPDSATESANWTLGGTCGFLNREGRGGSAMSAPDFCVTKSKFV
jgi:hypothetical protein